MITPTLSEPTVPNLEERQPAWDGLRGIAILMVIYWHYYSCVPRPDWADRIPLLDKISGYGWSGVQLFFTLSGFLIGRILIAHRGQPGYYRVFYLRRAARLLPLYFILLGLFVAARIMLPMSEHPVLEPLLNTEPPFWVYPLFFQNYIMADTGFGGSFLGVTWSLAVEEQFYLLLPVLIAIMKPVFVPRLMGVLVIFGILFRFTVLNYHLANPFSIIVLLPSRIDAFALGVLAGSSFNGMLSFPRARWIVACGFMASMAAVEFGTRLVTSAPTLAAYKAIAYTFLSIAFALALWHTRNSPQGHFCKWLSFKPLVWIGSVSYFVYLFHQPVNSLLHYTFLRQEPHLLTGASLLVTLCAFGMVLILAYYSRRYLEEPMIRLGKRCRYGAAAR